MQMELFLIVLSLYGALIILWKNVNKFVAPTIWLISIIIRHGRALAGFKRRYRRQGQHYCGSLSLSRWRAPVSGLMSDVALAAATLRASQGALMAHVANAAG